MRFDSKEQQDNMIILLETATPPSAFKNAESIYALKAAVFQAKIGPEPKVEEDTKNDAPVPYKAPVIPQVLEGEVESPTQVPKA